MLGVKVQYEQFSEKLDELTAFQETTDTSGLSMTLRNTDGLEIEIMSQPLIKEFVNLAVSRGPLFRSVKTYLAIRVTEIRFLLKLAAPTVILFGILIQQTGLNCNLAVADPNLKQILLFQIIHLLLT